MTKRISQLNPDAAVTNAALAPTIFESERAGLSYRLTNAQMAAVAASAWSATLQSFLATSTLLQAQGALGLPPTQTTTDTTIGRVMKVADFGIGNLGSPLNVTDANQAIIGGAEYRLNSAYTNGPTAGPYTIKVSRYDNEVTQLAFQEGSAQGQVYLRKRTGPSTWGTWDVLAKGGANSSITSLTGLTTPLSVAQGGTGVNSSTGTGAGVHAVSPALTGIPTTPTPAVGTNTAQMATAAMIQAEIANKRGWTSYTPSLVASTGTYTAASATGSYMVAFGICHWRATITITTKGTGAVPRIGLPVAALAGMSGVPVPARAINVNFKGGAATIEAGLTTALVSAADTTDLGSGDGAIIHIYGSYPVA